MGMHITIEIVNQKVKQEDFNAVFAYFDHIDKQFSPYKQTSEVTKINNGLLKYNHYSPEMQEVLRLSEQTKQESNGYFDVFRNGILDPSGLVKGWAIWNACFLLKDRGFANYYIDAGGDIQVAGKNERGNPWTVGIRNPFNYSEVVKVVTLNNEGIATSGTSLRGQHIYNPHRHGMEITDIISLTVISKNVYEADRFATAAFAMGEKGISFIENLSGFEGYMIDKHGIATYTSGFNKYTAQNELSGINILNI